MGRPILFALLLSALGAGAAPADSLYPHPPLLAAAERLSPDQAAAIAQRASRGRVLSIDPVNRDGRPHYRVKVLTPDGVVRVLHIDAHTGAVR